MSEPLLPARRFICDNHRESPRDLFTNDAGEKEALSHSVLFCFLRFILRNIVSGEQDKWSALLRVSIRMCTGIRSNFSRCSLFPERDAVSSSSLYVVKRIIWEWKNRSVIASRDLRGSTSPARVHLVLGTICIEHYVSEPIYQAANWKSLIRSANSTLSRL